MKKSRMAGRTSNEASSSNSSTDRGQSVLADCGRRKSSCGYCRSGSRSSISHGLWAHSITVDDYQDLLDRGWRRSGCFLYKPEMERTCCPAYTIRLRAGDFVPSKEQLRVSKRIQRFLEGTSDMKNSVDFVEDPISKTDACNCTSHEVKNSPGNEEKEAELIHYLLEQIDNVMCKITESGEFPSDVQLPKATIKRVSQAKKKLLVEGAGNLLYSSSVAFQIATSLRRAQSAKKDAPQLGLSGQSAEENEPSPKMIAEKLASSLAQLTGTHGLLIKACNGHINFYAPSKQASTDEVAQIVTKESGRGCDGSKRSSLKICSENPQREKHRLDIHLKRASFDPEEFSLYRRYQIKVHNDAPDRVTESSYRRFLVDTPLVFVPPTGDGTVPNCGFGSFHQQYVLDGRLVAVGVIDILPKCLSSKYLFWDPDFAFLSLGKYSALQEIDWIKENQVHCPSLQYYYLGYYIHSCNKMRYKAAYRPSELLCPLRYLWVPFDMCRQLLNRKPYVVLSDFPVLQNGDSGAPQHAEVDMEPNHDDIGQEESNDMHMNDDEEMNPESSDDESSPESSDMIKDDDVSKILIGVQETRLRYKDLQRTLGARERSYWENQLHRYTRVVGPELSEKMVYLLG